MKLLTVFTIGLTLGVLAAVSAEICVPLLECKSLLEEEPVENPFQAGLLCKLDDGSDGVLCASGGLSERFGPARAPAAQSTGVFFPGKTSEDKDVSEVEPLKNRLKFQQEFIISNEVEVSEVVAEAERKRAENKKTVEQLAQAGKNEARPESPESLQLLFAQHQSDTVEEVAQRSLKSIQVLTSLKEADKVSSKPFETEGSFITGLDDLQPHANFPAIPIGTDRIPDCEIPPSPVCDANDEKYRRPNGECNNLGTPRLGRKETAFSRFFPALYQNGIWEPRSQNFFLNGPLPSARLISSKVVTTSPQIDNFRSLSVMQFGQFINHDMISTATIRLPNGGGLDCCNSDGSFPSEPLHPEACNPIEIPADDPFYSQFGKRCINQVRSAPAPFENCIAGPANQMDQVTHYLDGSNIYGSSQAQVDRLRSFSGGKIKTSEGNLLPESGGRFFSGEGRNGENPGLTFMHTIWTREHNRVAERLQQNHPDWDDEKLYQEARRITVAEYQHIVYNEYVPTVLGFKYTREHALDPEFGHSFGYSEDIDPRITAEFSTAALRFGHSQVQDAFILRSETGRVVNTLAMEDTFFRGQLLKGDGVMAQFARSLTKQKPRQVDHTFSASVFEKLFALGAPFGLDLVALNIQRGRGHGLPTYVTVLENCLERTIESNWEGLSEFFEPDVLERLRSVYDSIFDIDLYIGGVSEKRKPGALVGEAFQCILGEQFFGVRYGDRFFYDNGEQPNSFSFDQLTEIQQVSWARVLCDNIDGLEKIQPLAFWQPSVFFNSLRRCNSFAIPTVDLSRF